MFPAYAYKKDQTNAIAIHVNFIPTGKQLYFLLLSLTLRSGSIGINLFRLVGLVEFFFVLYWQKNRFSVGRRFQSASN